MKIGNSYLDYERVHFHESEGDLGSFGIQVFAAIGRKITVEEGFFIYKKSEEIMKELMANTIAVDPKSIEGRVTTEKNILSLFPDPIFVDEIPNGYCNDYCCRHLPWYVVTTKKGRIKIGWRKSVLNIDWSEFPVKKTANDLFPDERVTKGEHYIHAWGYDKAREYIAKLLSS